MPRPARTHPSAALPDPATAEAHLIDTLAAVLAVSRTAQVDIAELRAAAVARDSSVATVGGGRARLGAALAALAVDGRAQLPASAAHWDHGPAPRLPLWARRPAAPRQPRAQVQLSAHVLDTLGGDAGATLADLTLRPDEVAVLTAVAAWLATGGQRRPVVPSRERSLQLFGDEKRLDKLVGSRLFTRGVLSMELLRAEPVPVPFVSVWVEGFGRGERVCVVAENHHTWVSLLRAARASADRHAGVHIGYGAGGQFCSSVVALALLEPAVSAVAYFGDLDAKGLEIPALAASATAAAKLPEVRPALGLYHRLFAVGVRRANGVALDLVAARARAAWLGPQLAEAAVELLTAGVRLPQEAVGCEVLLGTSVADWV